MSLSKTIKDLQNTFGKESVGNAKDIVTDFGSYSTGSIQLDALLNGGYPKGRLTEVYGPEGSGKSTSALHAAADAQSKGDKVVYMDLEGTFDKVYASALGVDIESLIVISPRPGEEALQIAEKLCKTGDIGLLIVDSIATMLPIKVEDDDYGKANMAFHAKLVGEFVKRFIPIQNKYKLAVVALNQLREKPGVSFGSPEYPTGGNAPKYYASVRIDIRKSGAYHKDKDGNILGEPKKIKIIKSKINASTNKIMKVDIMYGEGFDNVGEVVDVSEEIGIISKSGSWYSYDGNNFAQGRSAAKQFLTDNPEFYEELKSKVIEELNSK